MFIGVILEGIVVRKTLRASVEAQLLFSTSDKVCVTLRNEFGPTRSRLYPFVFRKRGWRYLNGIKNSFHRVTQIYFAFHRLTCSCAEDLREMSEHIHPMNS